MRLKDRDIKYYSYNEFIKDLKRLTQIINRSFDTVLPIARGGLTVAHFLSEYYNIRAVYPINSISYNDIQKLDKVRVFNIPDLTYSKNALIVDDIIDSGDTVMAILELLKEKYPNITFYTASIFYKKSAKIAPTWYVQDAHHWIDFFWTTDLQ